MNKILSVVVLLSLSISNLFANAENEIKKDILNMVTKNHKSSIEQTKKGLYLKANHCKLSEDNITQLEALLLKKQVQNPKKLIEKFSKIVCSKRGMKVAILKDSNDYIKPLRTGNAMYSGTKKLGEWSCSNKTIAKPIENISMFGIFMSKTQVSLWQVENKDKLRVWLAPFKVAPSDAVTLDVKYKDNNWKISGLCYSMRL